VQQVGSPTEIYDRPANTFVAGFIGNPAMNLIEGSVSGGVFTAANTEISGLNAVDQNITLAFRAEDARVVDSGGQINAPIYTLELLGDATMVTVRIGSKLVSVRADKNYRASIDDMVSIEVPAEICHLFDGQTGARIGD
jgi:multiple sugar transport system ATP-binding protein